MKLWRPGTTLGLYNTTISPGSTYHLKVVTNGSHITVYLGTSATPIIDVTDSTYTSGLLGLNVWNGSMTAQNVNVT